jgi:hypothetical protein
LRDLGIALRMTSRMGFGFLLISLFAASAIPPAQGSAGWYPTFPGDTIKVSFCLPSSTNSIAYLQIIDPTVGFKKSVAKIEYRNLKKSTRCLRMAKNSLKYGSSVFELEYPWRVNVRGDFALQLYIPTQKRTLFGWPDGIEMGKP